MTIHDHIDRFKEAKELVQWLRKCGVKIWRERRMKDGMFAVLLSPQENVTPDMKVEVERLRLYLLMFLPTGEPMAVNPWMRSVN